MPDIFDVAVIGAGPAGGSAALHAARSGLATVVLEEHDVVGEPVHCGECLSDLAIERMGWKLPTETVSMPVKGVRVVFPNEEDKIFSESGVVLEKHLFEQFVVSKAQNSGAQVLLGNRVKGLKHVNNRWVIETTKQSVAARILIDASGVQSVCNALLGLNKRFESVIGMQYELKDVPQDGFLDFYLWPKLAPQGYCWMIPKSDGRANVGLVTSALNKAKTSLDAFVKQKKWHDKTKVKTFGGLIPSSGAMAKTVSDGLMLVGDAAGFTSPLFEGGTQLGLMSGKLAALTAKEALDENAFSASFLKRYESRWQREFPPYSKIMAGKKALYGLQETGLNEMASVLPKELEHLSPLQYAQVGVNLAVSHRNLLQKGVLKAFEAFKYSSAKYYGW